MGTNVATTTDAKMGDYKITVMGLHSYHEVAILSSSFSFVGLAVMVRTITVEHLKNLE